MKEAVHLTIQENKHVTNERVYFKNLDIVRFFAAFAVVLAHGFEAWKLFYIEFIQTPEYTAKLFSGNFVYLDRFFSNLGIGVEVFFFISGFLITYILLVEKKRFGKISIWRFFTRRSLRIWPLYFLLLLLGPMLTTWMKLGQPDYLSLYLFYSNFQVIQTETWEYPFAHYWSLAIEEQFYVVWPFIISFIKNLRLRMIFILLILTSVLFRMYIFSSNEFPYFQLYLNTLARMDTLIIGAYLAYVYHKKPFVINLPKGLSTALLLCLLASFFFVQYNSWGTMISAIFKKYIYLSIIGILILHYISHPKFHHSNLLKRILTYLGKISYGIYMYHNILVIIVIKAILLNNRIESWTIFGIVYVLATLLMAIISFHLFEKWFLVLKQRFATVKTRKAY